MVGDHCSPLRLKPFSSCLVFQNNVCPKHLEKESVQAALKIIHCFCILREGKKGSLTNEIIDENLRKIMAF